MDIAAGSNRTVAELEAATRADLEAISAMSHTLLHSPSVQRSAGPDLPAELHRSATSTRRVDDMRQALEILAAKLRPRVVLPKGACVTMPAFGIVKAGDTVAVVLTGGQQIKFVVDHVDREAIVSVEGVRYPRAGIAQLQRQSVDYAKSVGLFFLLLGVIGNALL